MSSERLILFAWVVLLLAVSVWPAASQALPASGCAPLPPASLRGEPPHSVTVPFTLDHNRMLVDAELQQTDGGYRVIGIVRKNGKPVVEGVEPGDRLLQVGDLTVGGATMGTVVDALRGKPGENRTLSLERNGKTVTTRARVRRLW